MASRSRCPTPGLLLGLLILLALALQLSGGAGLWPVWARAWPDGTAWTESVAYAKPLTLADLHRISMRPGKAGGRPPAALTQGTVGGREETGLLTGVFDLIRETEQRQNEAALAEWAKHFEESSARQLAAARLAWDERFRDLAIGLGEEHDVLLKEYAAEVRREFFPTVSALEMQITMCEDRRQKPALEAKLADVLAQIEAKIAQRREGLARQCALELENLRNQAKEGLAQLEAKLQEEARRSLQTFAAAQGKEFTEWLARSRRAEESAGHAWAQGGR